MTQQKKTLYRLPDEAMIAGVASGFARYFNMDVTLMRLVFVGLLLVSFGAVSVAYIVLAVVMPVPGKSASIKNIDQKIEYLAEEVQENGRAQKWGNYAGIGLIVIGLWLLLGEIIPGFIQLQWNLVWPAIVIIVGILIIARGKKS